jgi:hypothetical protein
MFSARNRAIQVLACDHVATEDALRQRVRALIALGLTQKGIAVAIGKSPSWVTRWLDEESGVRLRVDEMDQLNQFFARLASTAMGKDIPNHLVMQGV